MTAHGKRGRGRSRKRRRASGAVAVGSASAGERSVSGVAAQHAGAGVAAPSQRTGGAPTRGRGATRTKRARGGGGLADMLPAGKRPDPPWHPLPLSELLILIGAIGAVIGLSRGISHGVAPLIAGLAAVAIGTIEVTLREHLSGYRSHTIMLAVLPVIAVDSALVLLLQPFGTGLKLGMVAIDLALFGALYRLLRARFADARRERVFSGGR